MDERVDGIHDLGGRQGFGPVEVEPDEPVFHQAWEGRVFGLAGLALASGGFNTPMFRHAIERMEPGHYLASSYYEHWLTAVTTLLAEASIVSTQELGGVPTSLPVRVSADDVDTAPPAAQPRFAVGDGVVVRDVQFGGHTRCPAYVRRRRGTIVRVDVRAPVPEIEAHVGDRVLEQTYTVRFDAGELWGDGQRGVTIHVDLYERYLEPV